MANKKYSKSSRRWLSRHFKDKYVCKAYKNKLRSRAIFKLIELNNTYSILKKGFNVLDLGAAPGSWSEYAKQKIGEAGWIVALDILPMKPIKSVKFFQGDLRNQSFFKNVLEYISNKKIHLVMSDMAPNMSGFSNIDVSKTIDLAELALNISKQVLSTHGSFLVKLFQGDGFNIFFKKIQDMFKIVKICKPHSSRSKSREVFILALNR